MELVVNGDIDDRDLAVFELPHGTIRMAEGLELSAGVVTNLTPDHMDEFSNYDEYIERNFSIKDLMAPGGVLALCGDDRSYRASWTTLKCKGWSMVWARGGPLNSWEGDSLAQPVSMSGPPI